MNVSHWQWWTRNLFFLYPFAFRYNHWVGRTPDPRSKFWFDSMNYRTPSKCPQDEHLHGPNAPSKLQIHCHNGYQHPMDIKTSISMGLMLRLVNKSNTMDITDVIQHARFNHLYLACMWILKEYIILPRLNVLPSYVCLFQILRLPLAHKATTFFFVSYSASRHTLTQSNWGGVLTHKRDLLPSSGHLQ